MFSLPARVDLVSVGFPVRHPLLPRAPVRHAHRVPPDRTQVSSNTIMTQVRSHKSCSDSSNLRSCFRSNKTVVDYLDDLFVSRLRKYAGKNEDLMNHC